MQISKKLYTSFIVTLLAISAIIAAVPMVSAEITIAPTLTPDTGAVGTEVNVAATAGASPFSTVTVYLDSLSGVVLGSGSANVAGSYSIDVTIPPTTAGAHYLVVNDGETESNGTAFTVTPRLVVNAIPAVVGTPTVLPGDQVSVTGDGFAANDAIIMNFTANNITNSFLISTPSITSDASGSFVATLTIPATVTIAQFDLYNVTAIDEATNTAMDYLNIDYYINCMPSSGPTGITTTISGRIAPAQAFAIRFNGATIGSGTTSTDGSYSVTYTIPAVLSPNPYTVDILWNTTFTRDTTFTVTSSPVIVVTPNTGIVGATIGITGANFTNLANVTLYFGSTVVNSTAMGFGPTNGTGYFDLTFVVPNLAPGMYAVSVVDQYGATSASGVLFSITPTPLLNINTRETAYTQGDQISIYTWSNLLPGSDFVYTITAPDGNVLIQGTLLSTSWTMVSANNYMVPYYAGWVDPEFMTLPADALVGIWNFTAVSGSTVLTNSFSVSAPATLDDVVVGIDEMKDTLADMTDMIDSIDGDVVTIKGDTATIENLINALDFPDMTELSGDLSTLQMTVEALAATVTSIDDGVATIDTTLGTLEGTITSIDGNTATIETDVGTLQADITDVKANVDSTPAWIAVVLALVAAVAAIFAVITIRQKIAG